jgi:hypothetical protein
MKSRRPVNSDVMFLSLLRLSVILLGSAPLAHASSCLSTPTFNESYSKANVIFAGTVVAHGKYGVWFRVDEQWKGRSSRTIYLFTGNLRNDLDEYFDDLGVHWLIYAYLDPLYWTGNSKRPYAHKLMSRACDRTKPLAYAAEDVKALDQLRPVTENLLPDEPLNIWRNITTRWTGAAGACFASNLVRRRLNGNAPPGQL